MEEALRSASYQLAGQMRVNPSRMVRIIQEFEKVITGVTPEPSQAS
jgi:hypothetical protein